VLDELQLMAEEEVKAFQIYGNKYRALNPLPSKPSPVKQGWEFKAYLLVSIASVLLASMRTAEQFYRAAVFSSAAPILGYVEAFLAVFTVEAGIVVYAAVMASRSRKVSTWVLVVGIILLAAISITAGMAQSLHLATDVDPLITHYLEISLSLLIGPGASIAALIGGHILGQQIAMAAQQYEQLLEEFEGLVEEYNIKLKKSWERSDERKTARKSALARSLGQEIAQLDSSDVNEENDSVEEENSSELPLIKTPAPTPIAAPVTKPIPAYIPEPYQDSIQRLPDKPAVVVEKPNRLKQPVVQNEPDPVSLKQTSMNIASPAKIMNHLPEVQVEPDEEAENGHKNGKNNGNLSKLDPAVVKRMQQAITKWLLQNGKTPFDDFLNYQVMGKEIGIDPQYIQKIIETMRISYKGHK
jgi:hypothetical protein